MAEEKQVIQISLSPEAVVALSGWAIIGLETTEGRALEGVALFKLGQMSALHHHPNYKEIRREVAEAMFRATEATLPILHDRIQKKAQDGG